MFIGIIEAVVLEGTVSLLSHGIARKKDDRKVDDGQNVLMADAIFVLVLQRRRGSLRGS
jgi:hypothetical protein